MGALGAPILRLEHQENRCRRQISVQQNTLENSHSQPSRKSRAKVAAEGKLRLRNRFLTENLFGRLGVGADNQRRLHFPEPPSPCYSSSLARGILTVRACTHHLSVRASLNASQNRIVAPIVEVFHDTRDCSKVLRSAKRVPVSPQKILGSGLIRGLEHCRRFFPCGRGGSLGHLPTATRFGIVDYEKFSHLVGLSRSNFLTTMSGAPHRASLYISDPDFPQAWTLQTCDPEPRFY